MKLYHNADIVNLRSIMEKGILSMDKCGTDHREYFRRADNATNVVYLHLPKTAVNSFTQYVAALIEVEVDDARKNEFSSNDHNGENYDEYVVDFVPPEKIQAIYIPEIFKAAALPYVSEDMPIIWCGLSAKAYFGDGYRTCTDAELETFAKTAPVTCREKYMYFRGLIQTNRNGWSCEEVFDLYEIRYLFVEEEEQ